MAAESMSSLPLQTFAELNRRLVAIVDPPESLEDLTATELNAALDVSCRALSEGTRFSATASETVAEAAICEVNTTAVFGSSNYEAQVTGFRFFDDAAPGAGDATGDALFAALKDRGNRVAFVERHVNKKWSEDFAAGDEYSAFLVDADNWQRPSDQTTGYIKFVVPLSVKDAVLNGVVATGI